MRKGRAYRARHMLRQVATNASNRSVCAFEMVPDDLTESARHKFPHGPLTADDLIGDANKTALFCEQHGWRWFTRFHSEHNTMRLMVHFPKRTSGRKPKR